MAQLDQIIAELKKHDKRKVLYRGEIYTINDIGFIMGGMSTEIVVVLERVYRNWLTSKQHTVYDDNIHLIAFLPKRVLYLKKEQELC